MNIKNVYILSDRSILYINGEDAEDFLQNIISNDINKINEVNSCFASLLTPQGKFLYEFIIIKHKSGYLLDCEKFQADGLFKQLSLYKLRSKVEILDLSNEFVVAAFSYEKFLTFKDAKDRSGFTVKHREDPIILDPRNKKLGARLIINLEKLYLSLKKLDLYDADVNEYYSFSHKLGIVPKNLNKKGCYVGQENTARIKLKNKLSKRLMPINIINGKLNQGEGIFNHENEVGKVLIDNDYPFALIKYLDKNFDENLIYKTTSASIKIKKPYWIGS